MHIVKVTGIVLFLLLLMPIVQANANTLPVLVYHGILTNPTNYEDLSTQEFANHMSALKNAGYTTITMTQAQHFLKNGGTLPDKSILLTFDDGRKDSFANADPALEDNNFKAVMFSIAVYATKENLAYYATKSETQDMVDTGRWEIESHTYDGHRRIPITSSGSTGPFLTSKMWLEDEERLETTAEYRERIEKDLIKSKKNLSDAFDTDITALAYPFGQFGQNSGNYQGARTDLKNIAEEHYSTTYYQVYSGEGFTQNVPGWNTFYVKRIGIDGTWTAAKLMQTLNNGKEKSIPYNDTLSNNKGWKALWGDASISSGILTLGSSSTTGAMILDGTATWEDYDYTARVKSAQVSSLTLMGRFKDDENYVGCVFSDSSVKILQKISGTETTVKTGSGVGRSLRENDLITLQVKDSQVKCLVNGQVKADAAISANLNTGGIGAKIYHPTAGMAEARFEDVIVKSQGTNPDPDPDPDPDPTPGSLSLPYKSTLTSSQGWDLQWGYQNFTRGVMGLAPTGSSTTAMSVFEPSSELDDYTYDLWIKLFTGDTMTAVARFQDSNNYLTCDYSHTFVRLQEYKNGVKTRISEKQVNLPSGSYHVGVRVDGNQASCLLNGQVLTSGTVTTQVRKGSVGIKVWDPTPNDIRVKIEEIKITEN